MGGHGETAGRERLHGLDAVRAFALLGGVALHATMSFLPGQQLWIVKDATESAGLGLVFYVLHIFRMAVFFLLAGLFGRMLFHRRGAAGFVTDRLKRIALPLIIFWPIVFPAIVACVIWAAIQSNGGAIPQDSPPPPPMTVGTFPLTHLWFLYVLLVFYATALAMRGAVAAIDRQGRLRAGADRAVRGLVGFWGPVLLAAPLALALAGDPEWLMWFGVKTPDTGLVPNLQAVTAYGAAFTLGWLLHRQLELLQVLRRRWPLNIGLAVILTGVCLYLVGPEPVVEPGGQGVDAWIYAACYAMALWSWTFGVIGLGMALFAGRSPVRRYLADASYWIYIVHLPLVMALQVWVAPMAWPAPLKFTLIVAGTLAVALASYQLVVRHTVVGGLLNARRPARREVGARLPPAAEPV